MPLETAGQRKVFVGSVFLLCVGVMLSLIFPLYTLVPKTETNLTKLAKGSPSSVIAVSKSCILAFGYKQDFVRDFWVIHFANQPQKMPTNGAQVSVMDFIVNDQINKSQKQDSLVITLQQFNQARNTLTETPNRCAGELCTHDLTGQILMDLVNQCGWPAREKTHSFNTIGRNTSDDLRLQLIGPVMALLSLLTLVVTYWYGRTLGRLALWIQSGK